MVSLQGDQLRVDADGHIFGFGVAGWSSLCARLRPRGGYQGTDKGVLRRSCLSCLYSQRRMENPWKALPDDEFVLPEDKPHVEAFNEGIDPKYRLNTAVLPQPFLGPRDASLIVLALNPGRRGWTDGPYAQALREDLRSERGTPFPALREPFVSGDGKWWKKCLGMVAEAAGRPVTSLADRVLAVEFLGYHSTSYRSVPVTLPSQHYSFSLVRGAADRGAMIVVLRGQRSWTVAVPELRRGKAVFSRNPRSGVISPGNFGQEAFERVVDAVGSGPSGRRSPSSIEFQQEVVALQGLYPKVSVEDLARTLAGLVGRGLTLEQARQEIDLQMHKHVPPISD